MADHSSDFIVIGSGLAGLFAALKLSRIGTVTIVTKRGLGDCATYYAQGGIAAVSSPDDSFAAHVRDTLNAGGGLCEEDAVRSIISEGPDCIKELLSFGVEFSRKNGKYDLGLEGGHTKRRVFHAGDFTGKEIELALIAACRSNRNIHILENHVSLDLILREHAKNTPPSANICRGVFVMDRKNGRIKTLSAQHTVLATGGAGKVYKYTSNPDVATGDGMAMAFRAGLPLKNMEFVQFHPTCLYHPKAKSFLISEALRGEGGILRLPDGTRFMEQYSPLKELAPRDVVARAIDAEIKKAGGECVYLDMTHLKPDFVRERFPNIYHTCLTFGVDITSQLIPVVPAAHFFCGGVLTDRDGATALPGLYCIGETSCTGLHGANRLASNSLLEACVFGGRVFRSIKAQFKKQSGKFSAPLPRWNPGSATPSDEAVVISQNWEEIRAVMWNYVGIVRSDRRLERARRRMSLIHEEIDHYYWNFIVTQDLIELRNIACVAEQIIRTASARRESRGLHFNIDCPQPREEWRRPSVIDRYTP